MHGEPVIITNINLYLLMTLFFLLRMVFGTLGKRYKMFIYFDISLLIAAIIFLIGYYAYIVSKFQLYDSFTIPILVFALLLFIIIQMVFNIIELVRKLNGNTNKPSFRIYKKETTYFSRFMIETVAVLIALPLLFFLVAVIFKLEMNWIELISWVVLLLIFSALRNYKHWWEKEHPED